MCYYIYVAIFPTRGIFTWTINISTKFFQIPYNQLLCQLVMR